ncbi:e3 ubiquitin-protein ligase synoviolin-like protein [Vairimorpha apis BRL 01]|uniref:E3 ubiquitin-protein ligase synoviolin-like protein n=1 Tax=Vairimorpha apis BRL 01 TaxID=1037528 RepID=T0KY92_9MICR|nr:e3 ubiquitin-protein ligase synoviolin-like protein [Vairimorpha apis BRL 01]
MSFTTNLPSIIKNKHFISTLIHLTLLSTLTFIKITPLSLYNICITTVNTPLLHLLHVLFILNLIYSLLQIVIKKYFGDLSVQEINIVSDNLFLFSTDILLVLSVFNKDINFRNLIVFFVILCFKILVWVSNNRIEYELEYRVVWINFYICVCCFILSGLFLSTQGILFNSSTNIYNAYRKYSNSLNINFLFSFEFCLISLNSLKNILILLTKLSASPNPMTIFHIDLTYLLTLLLLYILFIITTTIKFKIPIHLFRPAISILEKLIKKWRLFTKYKKICADLESIPDINLKTECPICTDEIVKGKKLRCGHVFHITCLKKWCERQYFCPICKIDLSLNRVEYFVSGNEILRGIPVNIERE